MHTEPARHRARNLIAHQITEHRWMTNVSAHGAAHHPHDFVANFFVPQKLNVLFPRQRDQNTHSGRETFFQEPVWRRMINAQHVQTDLAHHAKIDIHLFRPTETVPDRVRFERAVGRAFDEKLPVTFEKELRDGANPRICRVCHLERSASRTTFAVRSMSFCVWAMEMKPVSNWDGAKQTPRSKQA